MGKILALTCFALSCITQILFSQNAVDTVLAKTIDSIEVEDQRWRAAWREYENSGKPDSVRKAEISNHLRSADSLNMIAIKAIFEKHGYPSISMVGKQSSHSFWLIVQHCDKDPNFQENVLAAMKVEVDRKNASSIDYAYLVDRVKVNKGELQIYGTQMQLNAESTSYEPKPLVEPDNVNVRRREIGLYLIEDYIKTMNEHYHGSLKKGK